MNSQAGLSEHDALAAELRRVTEERDRLRGRIDSAIQMLERDADGKVRSAYRLKALRILRGRYDE